MPLGAEHCGSCDNDCTPNPAPTGDWDNVCLVTEDGVEQLPIRAWYCGYEAIFDTYEPRNCNEECGA